MKRLCALVAVVAMMSTVAIAEERSLMKTLLKGPAHWNLPNVKEAVKGTKSKAYYQGTAEDFFAIIECMSDLRYFGG